MDGSCPVDTLMVPQNKNIEIIRDCEVAYSYKKAIGTLL